MTEEEIQERFSAALERLDGDVELLCEMAAMTAPDCPAVIDRIKGSLSEGDCEAAAKALHKLKGMLSTFDTDGVVLEIQEMLEQARRGKLSEVEHAFQQQENEIERTVGRVKDLAASL